MLLRSVAIAVSLALAPAAASAKPFINRFKTLSTVASTVPSAGPAAGDVNPYGVAVVPRTTGGLVKGDILVSNFNASSNFQGTGSSIMEIGPTGTASVFAVVPPPTATPAVGLTTALVVLRSGFVIVGNLPAPGGNLTTDGGALTVLDSSGTVVETITAGDINGPWDMTVEDHGDNVTLFVTNVLNGTVAAGGANLPGGTVVRITLHIHDHAAPQVVSNQIIADGFDEHTDPGALVVGPTGLALGDGGTLYVADSVHNRIAAIPNALRRTTVLGGGGNPVSSGGALNDPLGVTVAPGGDILSVNGNDGNVVETAPNGNQVAVKELIPNGGGALFGLALAPPDKGLYFVNDAVNSLELLH